MNFINLLLAAKLLFGVCLAQNNDTKMRDIFGMLPSDIILQNIVPPGKDMQTCQGLWGREGYGCDKSKLIQYSNQDKEKMMNYSKESFTFVQSMKSILNSSLGIFTDADKAALAIAEKELAGEALERLSNESDRCWRAMGQIRSAALCTICSARNYECFQGRRGLITPRACTFILYSGCEYLFSKILLLSRSLKQTWDSLAKTLKIDKEFRDLKDAEEINGNRELLALLERKESASSPEQMEAISAVICDKTLQITAVPILYKLLRSHGSSLELLTNAFKKLKEQGLPSSRLLRPSNWRAMQATNPPVSFASDQEVLVMVPTDNMFSSFYGTDGSLELGLSKHRAMNLSLEFP